MKNWEITREEEYNINLKKYPNDFKVSLTEMRTFLEKEKERKIFLEDLKESVFSAAIDFSMPIMMVKVLMKEF